MLLLALLSILILAGCGESQTSEKEEFLLSIEIKGNGNTIPEAGTYSYEVGETITIESIANEGYSFSHWEGDYPSGYREEPYLRITIEDDTSLIAHFEEYEEEFGKDDEELDETREKEDFDGGSKGIFYSVEGGKNDLYLFGTLHYGEEDMYPLHARVYHYFNKSDSLGLELDLSEITEMEISQKMLDIGIYTEPQKQLNDFIDEETFNQVSEYLAPMGIDEMSLNQFKPWVVAQLVTDMAIRTAGYSPESGVEEKLLEMANEQGMGVIGLEEIEDQLGVFELLDDEGGRLFLEESIEEKEMADEYIKNLARYWKENDKESIIKEREGIKKIEEPSSLVEFYDALLYQRDKDMAKEISTLLEDDSENVYFIAVGYLHLVGEESIVENLKDKGYDVKCMYEEY